MMSPKTLLAEVATNAVMARMLFNRKGKPGEMISKLPVEEREILQKLKSGDIKNDRIMYL